MKEVNNNILNYFPNIELFYNLTYKKVSNYNLILAIPQGNKCFIWFTKINNKNVAILIYLTNVTQNNYNFSNIYLLDNNFNYKLTGTILYGTTIEFENKLFFFFEDIFYFKKINIFSETFLNKLNIMNDILNNYIYKIIDINNSIIIGIPPINTNFHDMNNLIKNIPYEIKELKYILQNETQLYVKYKKYNWSEKNLLQKNIFKVIPNKKTDIYNLYLLNKTKNEYEFHSIALIQDYKSSIMMNKIFHGLKEQDNLDYLEDSDDEFMPETDMENNWKFMECTFNNKFKKWIPIKVIE
jgi:hypothetical protein